MEINGPGDANNCHDIIHDNWSPAGRLVYINMKAQALEFNRHEKATTPMTNPTACDRRRLPASIVLSLLLSLLPVVASAPSAAEPPDLSVSLPPGETLLADVGTYRVFWQSYDQPPVAMPVSWSGHFEPRAGVSYQDWGRVLERRALLLHSPWHVPPGKTWADYELSLPPVAPIRLKFGIAMGPDVTAATA